MQKNTAVSSHRCDTDTIADIIAEFTEIFAFARTHFAHQVDEAYPEIKGVSMTVLRVVLREKSVTATTISQILGLDKAMVSRHVAKLKQLDLVATASDPDDGRVTLITPTSSALEVLDTIKAKWADGYRERFSQWSPDELQHFLAALHRFNHSV